MRKNLQTKVIQLLQRRDALARQLDGESIDQFEDEASQAKKFDEKEKRMIALQKETDEMKDRVDVGNRFKAEMAQGISILSQKLGVAASGRPGEQSSMSLPEQIRMCDEKVKELLVQKRALGGSGGAFSDRTGSAVNSDILSRQESNIRVKVPESNKSKSSASRAAGGSNAGEGGDDSESSDEEMFRNRRNSTRK